MTADFDLLGGREGLRNGSWLLKLFQHAFKGFWTNANPAYFRAKYPTLKDDDIAEKIIGIAAKNAGAVGFVSATVMSGAELSAFVGLTTGGLTLPASAALISTSFAGDLASVTRIQLKLIAELGKLYGVPLRIDDPEDVWDIMKIALFGEFTEMAGRGATFVSKNPVKLVIRRYLSKKTLKTVQGVGSILGIKILQRHFIQISLPVVSVGVSTVWNFRSTKLIGRHAAKRFSAARSDQTDGALQPSSADLETEAGNG